MWPQSIGPMPIENWSETGPLLDDRRKNNNCLCLEKKKTENFDCVLKIDNHTNEITIKQINYCVENTQKYTIEKNESKDDNSETLKEKLKL